MKLLDVELASVVHVGEGPARRRRTKREVTVSLARLPSSRLQKVVDKKDPDSPYLCHIVPAESALSEDLLSCVSGDEARSLRVPRSKDLIVVLLLVLGEGPGDLGSRDSLVLV
jgi:hypothetical protein